MVTSLAGKQILIVEDEAVIALGLETQLSDAGATAVHARTAEDALKLIDASRFDAAVLDVHLRSGDSYAIADALRLQKVPFAFLSGFLTIRAEYVDVPFLPKPYSAEKVIAVIAALVSPKS